MRFLSIDELRIQSESGFHAPQQRPYHIGRLLFPDCPAFHAAACCEFTTETPALLHRQLSANAS
jgi:hypothetical protein